MCVGNEHLRKILHFVGVSGAGKTTVGDRVGGMCKARGKNVLTTIDWDAHQADCENSGKRAFNRAFMGRRDAAAHAEILEHSLRLIKQWEESEASVIIVDRWYETYIGECSLPPDTVRTIEKALQASEFETRIIHLVIGRDALKDDFDTMFARLAHTKDNRPSSWWDPTRGTLEERALADCRYQALDREFCRRGTFPVTTICTRDMDWDRYARNVCETM